ncbi:putative repeat protein (TIGR01451 family) [Spirosoma oryzae]|uniref:Putative repeat protein (TIGR01451 family) n=1 Tax=Spirosoma oryzae TaxID=1469603 RepID=A0A2T0SCB3_9BACT|nr:DUF11 domain-containing protein [Spirosoma oryzae]PRY31065.1 putative repeat protein (TIGR01451 family) [Spirosoma oryzae]
MLLFTRFGLLVSLLFVLCQPFSSAQAPPQDTLRFLLEQEQQRLKDPALDRVPYERLEEARQQTLKRSANNAAQTQSAIPNVTWQERGPSNDGGRTRAILFNPSDASHKKVWAGSLMGGLWYTNDITDPKATWTQVSESWANSTITALAADPSNPQIMYAGTGDRYEYRSGGGIWKTTDGGANWNRLTATIPNSSLSPTDLPRIFEYISRLAVNQSGHVFAATQYGLIRSTDGGSSWSKVLAPNQGIGFGSATGNTYNDRVTDLEIGSDNTVFVAFDPSRVFRSLNANAQSWKEITPSNTAGNRTELALFAASSGSSQTIYAVAQAYTSSYSKDIGWFKRSSDGGDTWSDVTIPADAYSTFTSGSGWYALSLGVHPTDPNRVYAGGYYWYQSTDGGKTWGNPILWPSGKQHTIQFQPGNNTVAVFSGDDGVSVSTDLTTAANPTLVSRNAGYRAAEVSSVSQHPTPGNPTLLANTATATYRQNTDGLSDGKRIFSSLSGMGLTFIDDDTPSLQLVSTSSGALYLFDNPSTNNSTYLTYTGYNSADYDSQSNTLYTYIYTNGGYSIRRMAGIGSTVTTTDLPLAGLQYGATFIRLSKDRKALFVGTYPGKLYRVTNIDQSALTITAIDNGAFPQYSTPSAIDIGADDNELIVTLSNYGAQSVWYTRDGGQTWIGKDQSNYGLPDMPVRSVLFNPQNRKQVLLGTELGVWSTNDITASNPGWEPTNSGMGMIRVNQLRVRPSDNRITAATAGRGVFSSDALAIPYSVPSITLNSVSSTKLCAGSQITVSFSVSRPAFNANNRFDVYVSDATGNFANQTRIGSSTNTVVTATLPTEYDRLPYGTGYRIRVVSISPEVYSNSSEPIAIGDLYQTRIYDRVSAAGYTYNSSAICLGSRVTISAQGLNSQDASTPIESIQWKRNGSPISGATTLTYQAQQEGQYTATMQQAGCSITSSSYMLYSSTQLAGSIQSPTGGAPVCTGQTIPAICTYASDNATFQWSRDGSIISGATSYTLGVSQTGTYQCQITDENCTSSPNTLSISFQFGAALTASIRSIRGDTLLCTGANQYVAMAWMDDGVFARQSPYYSYQWYRDNVAITGATSSYYFAFSPGLYTLNVKQGTCSTRSNGLAIKTVASLPPTISTNGNPMLCTGETRTLNATPYGNNYQWQRDGVDIAGATYAYYDASVSGNYTARITNSSCPTTSAPLSLTFSNTIQPKITTDPQYSPGCRSVLLSQPPAPSGTDYQYQWLLNGSPLPGNTFPQLTVTRAGLYALQLTKGACSGTSNPVSVVFGTPFAQPVKPVIQRDKATALCANGATRLICNAYATLQWKRNGQALASTGSTFFATQSGLYTVVATDNNGCSAESDPVDIRIGEPTTAQLLGYSRIGAGQSAQLSVVLSGPAPWSFALTDGLTVQNTYQNPHILTVSPTTTTSYRLSHVTNSCGYGTVLGNPTAVFVSSGSADVSLQTRVSNRTPNVGDEVEYALVLTNDGPQDAAGVEVTSRLPAGLAFVSATAGSLTMTDTLLRGNVGTISAGSTEELRYKARVTRSGVFVTAAQVSDSQTPDPDSQPNSGTGDGQDDAATVDLRTTNGSSDLMVSDNPGQTPLPSVAGNQPIADPLTADLSLALYTDTSLPQPGDVITVRAVVSNRGGSTATSVAVQTKLPDGWTVANTDNVANSQNGASTVYANEVPAGRSATLLLIVKVGSSGGIVQSQIASVVEKDPDSTPGNGYTNGEDDTASLMIRTR